MKAGPPVHSRNSKLCHAPSVKQAQAPHGPLCLFLTSLHTWHHLLQQFLFLNRHHPPHQAFLLLLCFFTILCSKGLLSLPLSIASSLTQPNYCLPQQQPNIFPLLIFPHFPPSFSVDPFTLPSFSPWLNRLPT